MQKKEDRHLLEKIKNRRTFAIISHPDAGKTTLSEKLLLYGGAIREAGTVKGRKSKTYAVSDWMEIEKQRGISVTSSVLQFNYKDYCVNILDTPGHQDFSEDTYRTLMAADSAVMVMDASKGVENQTAKLFKVASMRKIPIFTLANKLDRHSLTPYELMEDLENNLGIRSFPMNWPIGSGRDFKGVYNRQTKMVEIFAAEDHGKAKIGKDEIALSDPDISKYLTESEIDNLKGDLELLDEAGDAFDIDLILKGELTPMFFGSALTNFGIETFLNSFLELSTPPRPRNSNLGMVSPASPNFSGFIFKIQANMNPAHRDRIAFLRICSGKFIKGMQANHASSGRKIRLAQP